jgi:hypothetical protein
MGKKFVNKYNHFVQQKIAMLLVGDIIKPSMMSQLIRRIIDSDTIEIIDIIHRLQFCEVGLHTRQDMV